MTDPIKVALLTDDPLLRAGLSSLLAQTGSINVVDQRRAEVALWDAGVDAEKTLTRLAELRTLPMPAVAVVGDQPHVAPALAAGARGVVLRDQVGPGIHAALAAVRSGLTVMDAALAETLVPGARPVADATHGKGRGELTERERQVVQLLVRGPVEQADRRSPRHQRSHREVPRQRRDDEARRFDPDRGRRRGDAPRPDPACSRQASRRRRARRGRCRRP